MEMKIKENYEEDYKILYFYMHLDLNKIRKWLRISPEFRKNVWKSELLLKKEKNN